MSRLLFSYEKDDTADTTTDAPITTATTIIPVTATTGFAVDQYIFICESDNSELTYLGQLQSINVGVSIVVEHAVANKATGSKVWASKYHVEFAESHSYPIKNSDTVVQAIGRAAGGRIRVSKKGIDRSMFQLEFEAMSKTDYDDLIIFYKDEVEGAGYTFIYSDVSRTLRYVKIINDTLEWTEIGFELYSGGVLLEEISETPGWI